MSSTARVQVEEIPAVLRPVVYLSHSPSCETGAFSRQASLLRSTDAN